MQNSPSKHPLRRGLHIHLGPRDLSVVEKLRMATPSGSWLLYVHPGDSMPSSLQGLDTSTFNTSPELLSSLISRLGLDDGSAVWTSSSCGLGELHTGLLNSLRAKAAKTLSEIRCAKAGGLLFLRASIQNLPSIIESGSWRVVKKEAFSGRGAIICGAGPSLRRLLPELKRLQGHCAIIAVGRACKTLLDGGVNPDLVCEMDSLCHVNWPKDLAIDAPLLAPSIVSPDVALRFKEVLWTSSEEARSLLSLALPEVGLSRSVGIYALDATLSLFGFEEAALLGFDLCFGPDGSSHADATASDDGDSGSLVRIPGRDGGLVTSNSLFNGMREAFEAHPAMKSGKVFNCSEGGAAIAGSTPIGLKDFVSRKAPFEFKGKFAYCVETAPCPFKRDDSKLKDFCKRHADSLTQESPDSLEAGRLAEDILSELSADFETRKPEGHCVFDKSLRPYALSRIERSHRAFAELLAKGDPPDEGRKWRLSPNMMRLPFVERIMPDGSLFRLSAHNSMDIVAGNEIEAFLEESLFDEAKDVAVFIAPGNWIHPVEFALRLPRARMLILEPYPELFSTLISRCQFLHKLPEKALVVGASNALPDWHDVWKRRIGRLKAEGFTLKFFPHPRTWQLPDVESYLSKLPESRVRPAS
jgi:hypothetical protein